MAPLGHPWVRSDEMTLPAWLVPLPDAAQQRALDTWAIEQLGIPGETLMERAGTGLARVAAELGAGAGAIAIVCGKGNNGGDGKVAARVLREQGRQVVVTEPGETPQLDGATVVIDALLGTGSGGAPRDPVAGVITAINAYADAHPEVTIVACDVPSGVDGSTGEIAGEAVRADHTVTFHAAKPGLWIDPGKTHAGRLHVIDIGIPDGGPVEPTIGLITDAVLDLVPRREASSTKFSAGNVVVFGGSAGLVGAPVMAARSAARAGAGYVTVAARSPIVAALHAHLLEVMVADIGEPPDLEQALGRAERALALVVGPGIGRDEAAVALVRGLARRSQCPLVLDADGLNAYVGCAETLAVRAEPTILTPHAGELARLLGVDSKRIGDRRLHCARKACEIARGVVVLKGDDTLVAAPDGRVAVSPGNAPALATAGTGDVLSGVIGANLAKGMEPFEAACAGVLVHVRAGQLAAREIGPEGVIASDVIERLPRALIAEEQE